MKNWHLSIIAVLIACAMFLMISHNVYASTCAVKETIYSTPEFFLLSDNVFVGNVTSITDYGNHQWQVRFDIEKIWKGTATRQTSTVMTTTLQACGYSINVGEKYLIYTNGSPSTINPIFSKMYSDAQNDIALFDDPKFQAEEKIKEDLNKKLEVAQGIVGSMMMDKSSHIPVNAVGVDQVKSTLDITIDDEKATLSIEQYTQNLKNILGDIPIKVAFGHSTAFTPILHNANDGGLTTSHPIIHGSNSSNALKSPLQQFKSGVQINKIHCLAGLQLVIKSSDNSPACVKPEHVTRLTQNGWTLSDPFKRTADTDVSSTKTYNLKQIGECDVPYESRTGFVPILYMPTGSTGKVCVDYFNGNEPTTVTPSVFDAQNLSQNTNDISVSPLQANIVHGNSTVVYTVTSGNKAGFYGLTIFCSGTPIAVGYDNQSRIITGDFPWLDHTYYCMLRSYDYHITGVGGGMGIKYVPP